MCDQDQLTDMASVSRRQFTALSAMAALAACTAAESVKAQGGLTEGDVSFAALRVRRRTGGRRDRQHCDDRDGALHRAGGPSSGGSGRLRRSK